MDYELLALMLDNYKRLYIEEMHRQQVSGHHIQYIVDTDINPAIAWAERAAEIDAEVEEEFK